MHPPQGAIVGSVNRRKGMILNSEQQSDDVVLYAEVPLNNMFGYSTELRSMTQGKGEFTMEYERHSSVTQEALVRRERILSFDTPRCCRDSPPHCCLFPLAGEMVEGCIRFTRNGGHCGALCPPLPSVKFPLAPRLRSLQTELTKLYGRGGALSKLGKQV